MFGTAKPPHSTVTQLEREDFTPLSVRQWQGTQTLVKQSAQLENMIRDTGSFDVTKENALFLTTPDNGTQSFEQSSFLSQEWHETGAIF